jgi:hypothetical protein
MHVGDYVHMRVYGIISTSLHITHSIQMQSRAWPNALVANPTPTYCSGFQAFRTSAQHDEIRHTGALSGCSSSINIPTLNSWPWCGK